MRRTRTDGGASKSPKKLRWLILRLAPSKSAPATSTFATPKQLFRVLPDTKTDKLESACHIRPVSSPSRSHFSLPSLKRENALFDRAHNLGFGFVGDRRGTTLLSSTEARATIVKLGIRDAGAYGYKLPVFCGRTRGRRRCGFTHSHPVSASSAPRRGGMRVGRCNVWAALPWCWRASCSISSRAWTQLLHAFGWHLLRPGPNGLDLAARGTKVSITFHSQINEWNGTHKFTSDMYKLISLLHV